MAELNRREFTKFAGAAVAAVSYFNRVAYAQGKGRVVVIGGGAGGATVAHHVKKGAPALDVTLIEVQPKYTSCFFSNLYLGGFRSFQSITHDYSGLEKLGVKVVHDLANVVDTAKRSVTLKGGDTMGYDKLVLSPGIDLKYDSIEGYSAEAAQKMPHAWQAGAQTTLLRQKLTDIEDGGLFILAAPPNPYRCPPGPYERASMVAHYLKNHKPSSKLLLLDPKRKFSKQSLFEEGWQEHYENIIELRLTNEIDDNRVVRVDPNTMEIETAGGERIKAAVANIVPAQKAGQIADKAGCTEGDWCPVDPASFESKLVNDVYVLGDASVATKMPKSAFSANSQAKVVVNDILSKLAEKKRFPARYRNTCWSLISTNNSVKVGASYTAGKDAVDVVSKFVSKTGEDAALRAQTYQESVGWYAGITADIFAKA